jgi:hypothetical protein
VATSIGGPLTVKLDKTQREHNTSAFGRTASKRPLGELALSLTSKRDSKLPNWGSNHALRTHRRGVLCHQANVAEQAARRTAGE